MARSKDIQARRKDIEIRLEAGESIIQAMFTTVTPEWIMFQAVVTVLLEEGALTQEVMDRMLIDAQQRLQQDDHPALSPSMTNKIAFQLDEVREELRRLAGSLATHTTPKLDYGHRDYPTDSRAPVAAGRRPPPATFDPGSGAANSKTQDGGTT
jgi:hypothetical protein